MLSSSASGLFLNPDAETALPYSRWWYKTMKYVTGEVSPCSWRLGAGQGRKVTTRV